MVFSFLLNHLQDSLFQDFHSIPSDGQIQIGTYTVIFVQLDPMNQAW